MTTPRRGSSSVTRTAYCMARRRLRWRKRAEYDSGATDCFGHARTDGWRFHFWCPRRWRGLLHGSSAGRRENLAGGLRHRLALWSAAGSGDCTTTLVGIAASCPARPDVRGLLDWNDDRRGHRVDNDAAFW